MKIFTSIFLRSPPLKNKLGGELFFCPHDEMSKFKCAEVLTNCHICDRAAMEQRGTRYHARTHE